ncbi:MAG: hypothetical protein ACTSRG_19145 [Candidatus Helarchaeota archaeon]
MKSFAKDNIKFENTTKKKMAIYSIILGLLNIGMGSVLIILGILDFVGVQLIPSWIQFFRNPNYASLIVVAIYPNLNDFFLLLELLARIFPNNKAFVFVLDTTPLIYDILKPDIFLGLILAIIGIIFLSGVKDLLKLRDIGVSHLVVASLLSLGFGIIYFLIFLAHGALYLLGNPDYYSWIAISDFGPAIWLSILSIPGGIIAWQIKDVK